MRMLAVGIRLALCAVSRTRDDEGQGARSKDESWLCQIGRRKSPTVAVGLSEFAGPQRYIPPVMQSRKSESEIL